LAGEDSLLNLIQMEIENGGTPGLDDDYITDSQIDSNGLLYAFEVFLQAQIIFPINTNTLVILMQIVS
jgi:hypothetical protein